MLTADMVHETGRFSYADAERLADNWNAAYPHMREISSNYITSMRQRIEDRSWEVDPTHPAAEFLRQSTPSEAGVRRKLKLAEDLRRDLGQLDRGTHKLCTRSPGSFTISGAYLAVRNLLRITSLNSPGLPKIYRLAAMLAEAEAELNKDRAAWHEENRERLRPLTETP